MKQLKKKSSKVVAFLLAIAMVATSLAYTPNSADAASKKKKKTKVSKVQITKPSTKVLVLKKGKTYKMKVKVTASKKKYKKVTYKSSKKKVATVSKSGKIKARKKGTTKITVRSKTNKKKKATLTVKVGTPITKVTLTGTHGEKSFYYEEVTNQDTTSPDYGKKSKVRKSKVTQKRVFTKKKSASVTITEGEYVTLKANYTPKKATYRKVSYKSSNKKVATVDSTGFILGKAEGTATITATAKDGSGKKAKVKVTVKKFVEVTTPAPTAVPDNRKTTTVENFESYAAGTNWDKYTTGGQANPGTMTVVADPLDPNNKVLKVDYNGPDQAYDFAPYFNVDLAKVPNAKEKLGNYVAMKFKVRVVSNTADCQYKQISGFFADYGTINRDMANSCSYEADHAEVVANPAKFKFLQSLPGMLGVKEEVAGSVNANLMNDNRYMPQYNNDFWGMDDNENQTMDQTKRMEGFAGYLSATNYTEKAEYSIKTLDFDRTSVNCKPYLDKSKFDMTFGSTYKGQLAAGEKMEYYIDDIELVEGEVATVPATSLTVDPTEKEMEVGDKLQLTTTVLPENTTDSIEYSSSDEKVATVAVNGMVTAVSEGAVTITAKANDNAKATCQITVKSASKEEVITQNPTTADERWTAAGTDTDDGLQVDLATDNYAGLNINLPAEITDFSKCKNVKVTFKMTNGSSTTDPVKFTFAFLDKDAKSNYDEDMENKGRLYETYRDVKYENESQQDGITYDAATGVYTMEVSLVGQSNMDKVAAMMIARNGSASATATVTIQKIEYTMKAAGEADPTDAYPFLAVPFEQDFNDANAVTSTTFVMAGDLEVEYKANAGVDGTGCIQVPANEYNGPSALLDNRKGTEDKKYYVEAMVKAASEDDVDGVVFYYAGYSAYAGFAKGGTTFDQMYLKTDDFHKMHDVVTVPAGAFIDLRIRGSKNFLIDNIKIAEYTDQDITDDDYPAAEPVDHVPFGSDLTADMTQEPTGYGFTAAATEGGVAVAFEGQYQEVRYALPSEVVIGLADSIEIGMTADANVAIKLLDANDQTIGSVSYNNQADKTLDLSGYDQTAKVAKIAFMSQDSGATNAVIKSIKVVSTKAKVDMTQEATGYGFTAAATEGGVAITFESQYQEARYALPQNFTIADIASIDVEMTADANVAIKLLDANDQTIGGVSYNNQADKSLDLSGYDQTAKVSKIAFMSQDSGTTNAVIKSITVKASKAVKADMTQEATGYGFTAAATEGGVAIAFEGQYQEARYALPMECSIAEFGELAVEMTADANVAIKLLDANDQQIAISYNNQADKTLDLSGYDQTKKIAKIAFMSQDSGATNAVVKSIALNKK